MKKIDIAAALVIIGLSAIIAIDTWSLPYWTAFAPGPAFASLWVALAGSVIGIALLALAILDKNPEEADWPDRTGKRQVTLGIALLWLLYAVLPYLGTLVSGLLFMMTFLLLVGRRPILPSIFASVFTVAIIEGVFVYWLGVRLPQGILGF